MSWFGWLWASKGNRPPHRHLQRHQQQPENHQINMAGRHSQKPQHEGNGEHNHCGESEHAPIVAQEKRKGPPGRREALSYFAEVAAHMPGSLHRRWFGARNTPR